MKVQLQAPWLLAALLLACGQPTRVYLGQDRGDPPPPAAGHVAPAEPGPSLDAATAPPPPPPPIDAAIAPPAPSLDAGSADPPNVDAGAAHMAGSESPPPPPPTCEVGRADCDGDATNGCETATGSDSANCGSCGHACSDSGPGVASVACKSGSCVVTCTATRIAPRGDCDGDPDNGCETQLWSDESNCGKCGNRCVFCDEGNCL